MSSPKYIGTIQTRHDIANMEPRRSRNDLAILGDAGSLDGVEVKRMNVRGEMEALLLINEQEAMMTIWEEHLSMHKSVSQCPDTARCFIAGLGLGLVLLCLAETGKAKEVIVCEIESRVVSLLTKQITSWLTEHYPDFNCRVIEGDAFTEVFNHGKFDWVFFDVVDRRERSREFRLQLQSVLSKEGMYTSRFAVHELGTEVYHECQSYN